MAKDKEPIGPINSEEAGGEKLPIENTESAKAEAEATHKGIDDGLADFTTELSASGVDNRDLVEEAKAAADTAHDEVRITDEAPVEAESMGAARNFEQKDFDYSGAKDWDDLYAKINENMGKVDAVFVIENINACRESKIKEEELPVTPNSKIKEVVARLKNNTNAPESKKEAVEKSYDKLEYDPRYVNLLEKQCLVYLTNKDKGFPRDKYNGEINEEGYLLDLEGKPTSVLASQCIGEDGLAEAKVATEKEFASLYPEDYKKYTEEKKPDVSDKNKSILENLEKDLGYLDIDPKTIWEKLTPEDIQALQVLMKSGNQSKINAFYQAKIKEVLVDQKKEESVNNELAKQMAESINAVIQQTIELEAQRELNKAGIKDKGAIAAKIALNVGVIGGTSILIGTLGIATGGVGAVVGAGAISLVRLAMRKVEAQRRATTPESVKVKRRKKEEEDLSKKKAEILDTIFSPDNLEKLRQQLSGHIANTLREQTSGRALEALRAYQQADGEKEPEVLNARFRDVEKQLYLNALTKVRAEHPEATPEQQQNMAMTLALTLGQHERGENLARRRLEEIRKSKPRLYAIIEKYNLLSAGSPDKKPNGMTAEEESIWQKSKYDLMSVGIGTAVGIAVRTSGVARVAMGAVAGAGLGYKVGEAMEKRDEKKALAEIVKMIDEAETVIKDIEFPTDQIEKLKEDSVFVKSKLDLGLMDNEPLLKSRAENFIHQVQKIELANQESLKKLLATVSERTDKRAEQVEEDLDRIGSKLKNSRLWATIGGAVVGGGAAWLLGELTHKEKANADQTGVHKPNDAHQTLDSSAEETPKPPQVTGNPYFEDKIDSTNLSGSDSIWRSTHQIFEDHAKELGYTGNINDHQALSAWAENQTANVVQHLNHEQGGNIKDLVHNNDIVRLSFENGKPHLSFAASSGIEAGHLPDTNVGHMVENQHFNANVDHHMAIDQNSGDQYLEIKSGDGVYRVYDWDRDGKPDVLFPDGHHQEMNTQELSKFLADKNIVSTPEAVAAETAASEASAKAAAEAAATQANEAASQAAAQQQVETFLTQGGNYDHSLFEAAKSAGHLDDLVTRVVDNGNETQIGALVWDYARAQGWSEDKIAVFMGAMRHGDKLDLSSGHFDLHDPQIITRNMEAFEKSALDSFDKVKDMPSEQWMPVRVGNEYFNVQKIHSGPWPFRSDHFLIDTNGDFSTDAINLDDNAMRAAFHRESLGIHGEIAKAVSQNTEVNPGAHSSVNEVVSRADSNFVELAKNNGAMDTFVNSELNPVERITSLASQIPDGKITDFNGIDLSQEGGKLFWHYGNQTPLEVNDQNINGLAEIMKIVRDKAGTSLPSNWEQQVANAFEQAVGKK